MRVPYNWLKEYIKTSLTPKEAAQMLTLAGHALDKPLYEQGGDTILDLEDRGNRADITGIIGIARDLAALTSQKLEYPKLAEIPKADNDKFTPKISVESERVIRWRAVNFKNIKVGPSPEWLQRRLKSYGIEVINNIVDITNYIMIELGMPIHAFDLDKVKKIILRQAKKGEKLITFEGGELRFDENDLLAADDGRPLTLTTAVGGRDTGISNSTTNILVEAGLYDQPTARRSALRLNVRNETAGRLGKYLHPQSCEEAIARTVELMKEVLGASPEPVSYDYYPNLYPEVNVKLTQERLDLIAGEHLDLKEAAKILERLEFKVNDLSALSLDVSVPYFRTDVAMEDDVIEEVLRIRGYDKIPVYLPNRPAPEKLEFPERDLEERAKDIFVNLGFTETVSQQIVDREDIKRVGFWDENKVIELQNSWNEELNVLRYDMASPQIKYLVSYQKHGREDAKIFEVGKTYVKDHKLLGYERYKEVRKIAVTMRGSFLVLKSQVLTFLNELGINDAEFEKFEFSLFRNQAAATIKVGSDILGKMGEVKQSILANFGVDGVVSHAVFYTPKLLSHAQPNSISEILTAIPNFVSEDKTFKVPGEAEVGKLLEILKNEMDPRTQINFVGVFENSELKKEGFKNVTFNFKFVPENSQTESEVLKKLTL